MNKLIITFIALLGTIAGVALAADATAGADLYNKTCKGCHGADGAAPNEKLAQMLGTKIPVLASAEIQAKSDDDIKKVITEGKGKMPAQKSVTGDSIDNVIAYLRTLKK